MGEAKRESSDRKGVCVTREEARASLEEIQSAGARARKTVEIAGAAGLLWTWGGVWLVGYLVTYGLVVSGHYRWINAVWGVLSCAGVGLTAWITMRLPVRSPKGQNIGWLWLAVMGFGAVWVAILKPDDWYGIHAFMATLIMFAWVMIGLIIRNGLWAKLGVIGALLIVAGYWWLAPSPAFWVWMGMAGGGMMLYAGGYLAWREKRGG